ncbi:alpha-N-arabinofuranosidase [Niastella yeongjuensis]|uniref:non-reducing end alpha-L-arabinofuranosidase n=1 Tax=Niastella yeongjuensis TaxID=354355 RepID=A0A1V9F881_9BACT|nr:alpha-L-arabinofuranosidase C-terminal domain-containing protein [Niastella yeongjuensis]OQP54525.1 alpha-N-arabinofuranosidase [Niastella yeongjuensis]SEN97702.1 Carbohydrate binding domain-containing protein [Niastella yeongjuensis]
MKKLICLLASCFCMGVVVQAQKPISPHLFGIFFEDINYAADGGLYAELIQNRSFEYSASDKRDWNPLTAWQFTREGFSYGTISIETSTPVHPNNPHYVVLTIEEVGREGVGLNNTGFDGIAIKAGEQYDFSLFAKQLTANAIPVSVQLKGRQGNLSNEVTINSDSKDWKKYSATLTATQTDDSAMLVIVAKGTGKIALDMISLFPQRTFKNRPNGLRADLAQTIADLQPKFMRFPGGCLVHGDGLGNMYQWKQTIGPVEQRVEQRNIWSYHQSVGLGYFEYFQFCEDMGAIPLPVVAAGVSCQNSGGTWRIGGTGQKGLSIEDMKTYIQDILDLIEWANGAPTTTWGAKRAAAGHPGPFHLKYIGIGNEDKITPVFKERFKMIYDVVHAKHPEITIIGTVGPFHSGEDYDLGWNFANEVKVEMVDEHYYEKPEWFVSNLTRYDTYSRAHSKVYVGEYAAHDVKRRNTLRSALAEALYMTSLERNGDVVLFASYAPLLGRRGHTQWNPNLIYFTGTQICPTINYYAQKLFANNEGDVYYPNVISAKVADTAKTFAASCVTDSKTGDLILKIVNRDSVGMAAKINLGSMGAFNANASVTVLSGDPDAENSCAGSQNIQPQTSKLTVNKSFTYQAPANSLTVIRIHTRSMGKK